MKNLTNEEIEQGLRMLAEGRRDAGYQWLSVVLVGGRWGTNYVQAALEELKRWRPVIEAAKAAHTESSHEFYEIQESKPALAALLLAVDEATADEMDVAGKEGS